VVTATFPHVANLSVIILDIALERTEMPERPFEDSRREISALSRSMSEDRRTRP